MISVFVVAATPMVRAGLRALLDAADVTVVGEMATLDMLPFDAASADVLVVADVALLDVAAPLPRDITVIVLSAEGRTAGMLRALGVRSWGIVPPDAATADLHAAVAAVAHGFLVLPAAFADQSLGQFVAAAPMSLQPPDEPLTGREREVLELVSQGLSNKMVARRLHISEHTVKFHVSAIYAKLGATNRTDAVSRATRAGLITL